MSKIYDEYLKLRKNDSSKLYLFKSGKFYIFVGEDYDLINEYVVLKKTNFSKETLKCGFPEDSLDQYLKVFKNHELDVNLKMLKVLIRISHKRKYINTKNYTAWSKKLNNIGALLGGWIISCVKQ